MEIYHAITLIVVLTAFFGYLNYRFIKLPRTIGIMLISLAASLSVIAIGNIFPDFFRKTITAIGNIDFGEVVLKVMLSFLLFSAAIQIDTTKLKKERNAILGYATLGVVISTIVVGFLTYWMLGLFGLPVHLLYCLLFGALISPTDPIAVSAILHKSKMPQSIKTKISGESLFNDGVAVVLFITIYEISQSGIENFQIGNVLYLFVREAAGGLVLGWLLGNLAYYMLKTMDNYVIEVLITLAVVMGGYTLAEMIHVSGVLAMVAAGLITRNKSMAHVLSDTTRDYLGKFWEMIDEVMNAILFLLIGFEMLIVPFNLTLLWLGLLTVLIVLFARLVSVSLPILVIRNKKAFENHTIPILTWGALRGAISVALALSLPKYMYGEMFVTITYIVVLFSIVVQGLTIDKFAMRLQKKMH